MKKGLLLFAMALAARAQLMSPNEAGVAMGHLHLNTSDVAAQQKFWVEIFGATPVKLGGQIDGVKLPGVVVLFKAAPPTDGTIGSTVNHIGLKVKDADAMMAQIKSAGLSFDFNPKARQVMVMGPDKLQVELTEDKSLTAVAVNHHIHFHTVPALETQAWYVKTFGAKPGKRAKFEAADLPGVNLTFSKADSPLAGTKGRALDHIGFEVKNLEAFCKNLETQGVKFDVPYRQIPVLHLAIAFFTDPWGTYIELTEGLDKL